MVLTSDAEKNRMKSRRSAAQRTNLCVLVTITLACSLLNAGAVNASNGFACPGAKPQVDGMTPVANGHKLVELFPELPGALDATTFAVSNKWMGLSLLSPAILEGALALSGDRFEGEASVRFGVEGGDDFHATRRKLAASRDGVQALLCAALNAPLEERAYEAYRAHTDDYPDLAFTFQGQAGPLMVFTRSQPHVIRARWVQTPWAISYAHRIFVVSAPDIDAALDGLLPSLDIRLRLEK